MSIPAALAGRLSIPVIGSPLFIISNPDLVIAQCRAGVVGSFPSLNARPLPQFEEWLQRLTSRAGAARRALCGQPHRPPLERPADGRPGAVREVQGADGHHQPRRAARRQRGDPQLWRHRPSRHHQRHLRAQGGRQGRRRADRGRRRRGRPCRDDLAVRAGPGDPPLVRRAAGAVGVSIATGGAVLARAGDGGRLRLYRLGVHRHRRGARRRALQADDRRQHRPPTSSIRACSPACTAIT